MMRLPITVTAAVAVTDQGQRGGVPSADPVPSDPTVAWTGPSPPIWTGPGIRIFERNEKGEWCLPQSYTFGLTDSRRLTPVN